MRSKVQWASALAVAATMFTALFSAGGSGASAQELVPAVIKMEPVKQFVSEPVVQPLPVEPDEPVTADAAINVSSLAELVAAQPHRQKLSKEMRCLAGAIYFEARGESLEGQLAVGRVIIERSESQRFPDSYCGVVFQRGQFSFVRGGRMPAVRKNSPAWRKAVAVAQIADAGSWESPVEGALFFHATAVSPRWRLTRVARVDNHIFYR